MSESAPTRPADPRPIGPFAISLALVLATTDLTPAECDDVARRLGEMPLTVDRVSPDGLTKMRLPMTAGEMVTQVRAVLDAVRAER